MALIIATKRADSIIGTAGRDVIYARAGGDVVDSGAGSDLVFGGAGNDTFVHRIGQNRGAQDFYDGGKGQDTLVLDLTGAEWARANVKADVTAFLAQLESPRNESLVSKGLAKEFSFSSTNLKVDNIEHLRVIVDGREIDLHDDPVVARHDELYVDTNYVGYEVNLLANDSVPDGVAFVEIITTPTTGIATIYPYWHDGEGNAAPLVFSPNTSFRALAPGEIARETLLYRVTDLDGDTAISSVTINIIGVNDQAEISGDTEAYAFEDGVSPIVTGDLTIFDIDGAQDEFFVAQHMDGTYGAFSIDAQGHWVYTLDNDSEAVQALNTGYGVYDRFEFQTVDGTYQQVQITLFGADETPPTSDFLFV